MLNSRFISCMCLSPAYDVCLQHTSKLLSWTSATEVVVPILYARMVSRAARHEPIPQRTRHSPDARRAAPSPASSSLSPCLHLLAHFSLNSLCCRCCICGVTANTCLRIRRRVIQLFPLHQRGTNQNRLSSRCSRSQSSSSVSTDELPNNSTVD